MIVIVDFGSQTCHLIGRRIRDMGVDIEIVLPSEAINAVNRFKPKGIIFSGGPASVYEKDAVSIDAKIFETGIPILGICYGFQLMAHLLGGKVARGKKKEYGPALFQIISENRLLAGLLKTSQVWMSHFTEVLIPPKGAMITGSTDTNPVAAFADEVNKFYGVQFHPEAYHTSQGDKILSNFVLSICGQKVEKKSIDIDKIAESIKEKIGKKKAICALSGGIDSAVAAVLTYKAIGKNLICLYVDTGLMRQGETKQIIDSFAQNFQLPLGVVHAQDVFFTVLKGVIDPEQKRKIIGETFIRVFEREAKQLRAPFLIQGTIYPDVIESKGSIHADMIKTHHNVGGIPAKHGFQIVEPLRMFYKDEVREIAKQLNFPSDIIHRHVFPGPGLAVRIIGEVTKEKVDILKRADAIVVDELKKSGLYEKIWMGFAVFTGVKSTGVTGDERKYGETIAIRVIESKDTMTADWVRLPYDLLDTIANRIVTEVFEVVRVVYDITTKPPATMEWE